MKIILENKKEQFLFKNIVQLAEKKLDEIEVAVNEDLLLYQNIHDDIEPLRLFIAKLKKFVVDEIDHTEKVKKINTHLYLITEETEILKEILTFHKTGKYSRQFRNVLNHEAKVQDFITEVHRRLK